MLSPQNIIPLRTEFGQVVTHPVNGVPGQRICPEVQPVDFIGYIIVFALAALFLFGA